LGRRVIAMDESAINQNRRTSRSKVLLQAEIEAAGSSLPVKLRDLSVSGALIEGPRLPVEGSCVLLRRNELQVSGRLAWSNGTHAGLAFDTPIKPEEVLRTVRPARPKPTTNFRRPALTPHHFSAEEEVLIKIMANSVADLVRREQH